ncbi:MAG: C10 family peptidase [Prevotella sp.]|nr:C10 family peptidase [Prevotella sp.]
MRKLLLLVSLFVSMVMMAGQVDQETAKQKAIAFASAKMGVKAQKSLRATNSGVRKASNRVAERDYLHVFNIDGGGYVIVSGDDRTEEILGYSLTGTFDANKIPDNMRGFLQEYVDGIQYLDDHNIKVEKSAHRSNRAPKASIKPLVETKWDQWAPYNLYCPQINEDERGLTGCGATALAQILKYHEWPKTTPTIPAYVSERLNMTIDAMGPTTIDWGNMKDTYTCYKKDKDKTVDNADDSEKAVGMLMRLCGQALEMDYGTYSMGGSAAYTNGPYKALLKYFDYEEETLQFINRANYSYERWQELIYNELANKRPVLYTGQSAGGGHLFVCDGYDKDDFFHINWGWSGGSDDYFRLYLLNPYEQGAGGSSTNDGYGVAQDATIGIQKNNGTVTPKPVVLSVYRQEFSQISFTRTSTSEDFKFENKIKCSLLNIENEGTYNFDVGVRIMNASNSTVLEDIISENGEYEQYKGYFFYLPNFGKNQPDGTYKLYFLCRETGTTTWRICKGMEDDPILFTISGNKLTFTVPESVMADVKDLEVTPTVEGELKKGSELTINIAVKNNNTLNLPFRNSIYYDVNGDEQWTPAGFIEVEGGQTATVSFKYIPKTEGKYKIRLVFWEKGVIWEKPIEFVVGEPTPEAKLEVTDYDSNTKEDGETYYVEGDEFKAAVTVKNTGEKSYTGNIIIKYWCHVIEEDEWYWVDDPEKKPLILFAGKETTINASLTNPQWDECDLYCIEFWYTTDDDDAFMGSTEDFEFRTGSGINMIKVVPKDMTGKIYDLQGRRIDATNISSLKPGMYVIDGKKVVIKKR